MVHRRDIRSTTFRLLCGAQITPEIVVGEDDAVTCSKCLQIMLKDMTLQCWYASTNNAIMSELYHHACIDYEEATGKSYRVHRYWKYRDFPPKPKAL